MTSLTFHANPNDPRDSSLGYWAGSNVASFLQGRPWARRMGQFMQTMRQNPQSAGLQGAGVGALLGGGYGLLTGKPIMKNALIGTALGGLGTLGASMAGNYVANKTATAHPISYLRQQILADMSSPSTQKSDILQALPRLSEQELQTLAGMIRAAFGAGAAAIAARFLLKTGIMGTMIAALGGGLLASRFGGGSAPGVPTDPLGRSRFTF